MPHTISDVETRYWDVRASKFAAPPRMMGGVMMPASMDSECWNPSSRARRMGIRSLSPKKGAARRDFFMKGRLGLNKKA